jgi:hypothetical protein
MSLETMNKQRGLRRLIAGGCAAALLLAPGAAQANLRARQISVESIMNRIEAGDCSTAVSRLKTGLGLEYPEVMELAGSMYENGLCVKRDWQRAVTFYIQAHEAGVKDAASRLAAGYADPANGPDIAAALWWFARTDGRSIESCKVSKTDPDGFVAELSGWSQQKLVVCNYIVGVMATIAGELRYPDSASALGVGGSVALRFHAALPRVDVRMGETEEFRLLGLVEGDDLRDRSTKAVRHSFEGELRKVADRALRRYPQPAGIAADTVVNTSFHFTFGYE